MSVRLIAQEAGLSLGMVHHHFRSKDELLAATLSDLSSKVQDQIILAMARPRRIEQRPAYVKAMRIAGPKAVPPT